MKNSKLIEILRKFEMDEILLLKQFIASPYFVKQESLVNFAARIVNEYPQFKPEALDKKILYRLLYPGKAYNETTINKLMHQAIFLIHQFLTFENFRKDPYEKGIRLMEELRKKSMDTEFQKTATDMHLKFEANKKDQQFYYNLMRYDYELALYGNLNKEHLAYPKSLGNQALMLDAYFIYAKLKLACEMINRQKSFSTEYDLSFLEQTMKYIELNPEKFDAVPAIRIYYWIVLTLLRPEEQENYKRLILLLGEEGNNIEDTELRDMYGFARNYCIRKINNGEFEFVRELFNLFCRLLNNGIIYENNYLSQWDYKNIATIGLRLKEFEWTENFIISNKDRIQLNFRNISFNYSLANLYYAKQDFANALRNLNYFNEELKQISDPEFDDIFYNLDSRAMFLKIYYELGEDETFMATIETFKSYLIRNKKISDAQKNIYLNLLKYTKKLNDQRQRLIYNHNKRIIKTNVKKLRAEINSNQNIVNLSWLQARVEELEKEVG